MSERQANKVGPLRVRIAELELQLQDTKDGAALEASMVDELGETTRSLRARIAELERQLADRDLRLDYLRNLAQVGTLVTDGYSGNPRLVKHALWGETFEWPEGTAE